MGRSSLLTQGSLNKAMLCSKPLHFRAGGLQVLSPPWLLHLSPALDLPGLLCPSCAGVGQAEAQRNRDWSGFVWLFWVQPGSHSAFAAPGARAVLEESCTSSFGFPMGQVQSINSSRTSQELREPLVLEGSVSWAGDTQESLWGAFQGCLVPGLGSSAHPG